MLAIKRERLKQGVSATKLAALVGLSRSGVTHMEAGRTRPTFWALLALMRGLGLNVSESIRKAVEDVEAKT